MTSTFVYKTLNGLIDAPIVFLYRPEPPYQIRNIPELVIPLSRSQQSKKFIYVRGPEIWNNLQATNHTTISFNNQVKT